MIYELQKLVSDNPSQVLRVKEMEKILKDWQREVVAPTIVLRSDIHPQRR